jgi:hypothetical protein
MVLDGTYSSTSVGGSQSYVFRANGTFTCQTYVDVYGVYNPHIASGEFDSKDGGRYRITDDGRSIVLAYTDGRVDPPLELEVVGSDMIRLGGKLFRRDGPAGGSQSSGNAASSAKLAGALIAVTAAAVGAGWLSNWLRRKSSSPGQPGPATGGQGADIADIKE